MHVTYFVNIIDNVHFKINIRRIVSNIRTSVSLILLSAEQATNNTLLCCWSPANHSGDGYCFKDINVKSKVQSVCGCSVTVSLLIFAFYLDYIIHNDGETIL